MERQIEGIEWVLALLFALGVVSVLAAAVREFRKLRAGDPGGEEKDSESSKRRDQ
jgi:hypothetical protein